MNVLIAPDKFKGSLTSQEVAEALATGVRRAGAHVTVLPLADGGDGSVAAAISAGATSIGVDVAGPTGRPHRAEYAVRTNRVRQSPDFDGEGAELADRVATSQGTGSDRKGTTTAYVEIANTCGFALLPEGQLEPLKASSYGLGEAMIAALHHHPDRLVVALGGSASTDGGLGILRALGAQLLDADGRPVAPNANGLRNVAHVDLSPAREAVGGTQIVIASDVAVPLCGDQGTAGVFGPQKGADDDLVQELDAALAQFANALGRSDLVTTEGSGAAGGAGFALLLLGGRVVDGADYFLNLLDFDTVVADADIVITGEGGLNDQTLMGKLPVRVARRCGDRPVHIVAGTNTCSDPDAAHEVFASVRTLEEMTNESTADNPELTKELLAKVGEQIVRELD